MQQPPKKPLIQPPVNLPRSLFLTLRIVEVVVGEVLKTINTLLWGSGKKIDTRQKERKLDDLENQLRNILKVIKESKLKH